MSGRSDAGNESRQTVRRFKLTAELSEDGSAAAVVVLYQGGELIDTEMEMTVHDSMGMFSGESGTYGYAIFMADAGRWEVLQLACAG